MTSEPTGQVMGPPWSATVRRGPDGALVVGGVDVRRLAQSHGTPAYVLDEVDLRARARGLRTAFTAAFAQLGAQVDLYYAAKAFICVAVAQWVHDEGLAVDTATGGELGVALFAGVPPARIGLHGNNKSDAEIARALDAGVGRIVIDAPDEA
ncbi:MAG: diaminopimelate decarboxylase, partial [Micrococcales bacterium]|nr:diaminopimelate decarboxylase [Micrococcales bacterium]